MAVGDAYVFPGFLTPVLTQLSSPKPPTTFLTCFLNRGERRKYPGKKNCVNWGLNSQPPGHESDTLTTEPTWLGSKQCGKEQTEQRTRKIFLIESELTFKHPPPTHTHTLFRNSGIPRRQKEKKNRK